MTTWTPSEIVAVLEKALVYLQKYPTIIVGHAVGLSAIDDSELAAKYAALLKDYDPANGIPSEISEEHRKAMQRRYKQVYDYILRVLSEVLNTNDLSAIAAIIERFRRIS